MASLSNWAEVNGVEIRFRQDFLGGAEGIRHTATLVGTAPPLFGVGDSQSSALDALASKVTEAAFHVHCEAGRRTFRVPCFPLG